MNLTIVADENIPGLEDYFGAFGSVRPLPGRQLQAADLAGADVLLVRSVTRVDEALLRDSALRFVGTATSGLEHVDRQYLASRGIAFAAAPGANANSVVEYVLSAIAETDDFLERLLDGGTLGVVGYGAIGRLLVQRCEALGIDYRVSDPWLDQSHVPRPAALDAILGCDVVSLHCELTTQQPHPSYHLIGATEVAQLVKGQLLINASRGAVVNNAALSHRLRATDAPVVVLDVWEGEPEPDADLADQVRFASAHIAGYSLDAKLGATAMLRDALVDSLHLDVAAANVSSAQKPGIILPAWRSKADFMRALLTSRYHIAVDDALLRNSLQERAPGAAFDRLRREYRARRELAGSHFDAASAQQRAVLHALGCRCGDAG